jgi:hypothetical protein
LQIKRDKYDVDEEGGGQVAAGEFDSEYDAASMQAVSTALIVTETEGSCKIRRDEYNCE